MAKFSSLFKKTQINSNFQYFLNCSWLLYLIFFLAACDLYIFAVNGELLYVTIFVLIGFLATFFSKNMTVILLVAMILTNIFRFGKDVRVKEGMESAEAIGSTSTGADTIQVNKDGDEGGDYQFLDKEEDVNPSATKKKSGGSEKPPIIESIVSGDTNNSSPVGATTASPAAAPISATIADITDKTTGLDQDTADLLQKQKKLMESMRNLEPMLSKAETLLEKFKNQSGF